MFKIFASASIVALSEAIQLKSNPNEVIPSSVTYDWNCGPDIGCAPIEDHPVNVAQMKIHEGVGAAVEWKKHNTFDNMVNYLPTNDMINTAEGEIYRRVAGAGSWIDSHLALENIHTNFSNATQPLVEEFGKRFNETGDAVKGLEEAMRHFWHETRGPIMDHEDHTIKALSENVLPVWDRNSKEMFGNFRDTVFPKL